MKKAILIGVALTLVLSVTGCSAINKVFKSSTGSTASGALTSAAMLAAGTLKLEGTANALTAEQATSLLPLWKAYRSVSQSSSASSIEMEALVKQIKGAMTAEQVAAITALKLTNADVQTIMQEQGASMMGPNAGGTPSADNAASRAARSTSGTGGTAGQGGPAGFPGGGGAMPSGGGFPSGGFPGGGAMPADGGGAPGMSPNGSTTPQARSQSSGTNPMLIMLVINLLQTKTGAQPEMPQGPGQAPAAAGTPAPGQAPAAAQTPTPTPGA